MWYEISGHIYMRGRLTSPNLNYDKEEMRPLKAFPKAVYSAKSSNSVGHPKMTCQVKLIENEEN
jgi:hypothetical protein